MRSALAQVRGRIPEDFGEQQQRRREVLALYRWTGDGSGIALWWLKKLVFSCRYRLHHLYFWQTRFSVYMADTTHTRKRYPYHLPFIYLLAIYTIYSCIYSHTYLPTQLITHVTTTYMEKCRDDIFWILTSFHFFPPVFLSYYWRGFEGKWKLNDWGIDGFLVFFWCLEFDGSMNSERRWYGYGRLKGVWG